MLGSVLHFSVADNQGLISGDDGTRYRFVGSDWRAAGLPLAGTRIDFVGEQGIAKEIFAAQPKIEVSSAEAGLYRSSDQVLVGGVCAGLAHRSGIPVWVMRVLVVALSLFLWWATIPLYVAACLTLPRRPTDPLAVRVTASPQD
jgi:phage shock protein PspC (stress-responsive transcriptional regulator)